MKLVESIGNMPGRMQFPDAADLPLREGFPDPLVGFSGKKVVSREEWQNERRPELAALFRHYMYGTPPPSPPLRVKVTWSDAGFLGGRATLKEISLGLSDAGAPSASLLLAVPNAKARSSPAFLGLNFYGNHLVLDDPRVLITKSWVPEHSPGGRESRATEAGRGAEAGKWTVARTIERGYAFATLYCGDVDPDRNDRTDGVHPHYPAEYDWGTIAAWAWGLSRAVDCLVTEPGVDGKRIAVVGHSRLGKTALLAAAFDERIALAIPNQAGCGGTAPSRGKTGESVREINEAFPHWFNSEFKKFNDSPERLPFDQHCLVAMMAPRPVLFSNAEEDEWANPAGQFDVLKAADPVYRFLGVDGLEDDRMPERRKLSGGRLGYWIREGGHAMGADDWETFLSYADRWL